MKTEDVLRLIVIDDSSNDAENVSNMLRNEGQVIRTERAEDDEDLRNTLSRSEWDMIVSKAEIPYFSAIDAVHVVATMKLDIPVIVLADGASPDTIISALQAGARDAVALAEPERLKHAILREFSDLKYRRQYDRCRTLLLETDGRANALVDSSRDAIAYVHEGMHIYANQSYLDLFGYSALEEIEGMPIMDMVIPGEHNKFKEFLRSYISGKADTSELEVEAIRLDGSSFKTTMEFSPASYEGESCTQIIIRDQSLSQELEKKLNDLTKQDLLTGVFNRTFFLDNLKHLVGKPGKQGAIFYIEPDSFKQTREEVGIAGADMMLADIASILNGQLDEQGDILARFDGQLFTALLPQKDINGAEEIATRMCKAIEDHIFDIGGHTVTITCSIGVTLYNDATQDPQELLSRADKARRAAAGEGGNRCHIYNPAAEEMAENERMALWAQQIKSALRENTFRLLFQPIVDLHGGAVEHYEVLLRMLDDAGHDITPHEFLPAAQKAGLMAAIDRWVMAHGMKALAERCQAGKKTSFFIKLSADSLKDEKLLPWLRDLIQALKLPPESVVLEVNEEVANSNLKALKQLLAGLEQLHIHLALDHFGANARSATLLKHISARYLKLDGSLIRDLATNAEHKAQVQELATQAKEEGKKTIAQFIEDANTLAAVWGSGIDMIQGYFLQEPNTEMSYDFSEQ